MIDIPSANLPKALDIPQMYFRPPTADVPAYKPMIVPPADLEAPPETKTDETKAQPEPPSLKIPNLPPIPIPSTEVLVTTSIAAVTAVAATTFTQPIIENVKKKVQKFLQGKINKWKENRLKKKKRKDS